MANQETNMKNWAETTLTSEYGPTALTAVVSTTTAVPASPCYLVIEPDSPTQREVILFDGTFTATNLVTTVIGNRYLAGSAAGSGLTHPIGSVVRHAPLAQHFEDINDRMDIAVDHGAMTGLGDDDHPQYIKDTEYTAKGDILGGTASGTFAAVTVGADGTLLTADSGQTEGVAWVTPNPLAGGLIRYPFTSPTTGDYLAPYAGSVGATASASFPTTADRIIYTLFICSYDVSVNEVSVRLSSSAYPTNLRVGLYNDSGGAPGTLIANSAGEKTSGWASNSWNGVATTATVSLSADTFYWLAVVPNNAAAIYCIDHNTTEEEVWMPWKKSTSDPDKVFASQNGTAQWPVYQEDITYASGLPSTATPVAHTLAQFTGGTGILTVV